MLVIDKSKENLLTMKAKELEIGSNKEKALQEYKELVIEIDNEIYNHLINKIEGINLRDLSLEEQLVILEEIDEEYTDIYEKQCGYENVYQRAFSEIYGSSSDDLELNDLSSILIDDIRSRISVIQGYLINVKSIQENKQALEALNLELIEESKKKDNLLNKFVELEAELKNNFLNTEGRNYDANGNLIYNSVVTEYEQFGLNLEELLNNSELINKELNDVNDLKKASDEELLAAKICYERVPSDANREILTTIKLENAKANYKLVLLYMANLVAKIYNEYSAIILKRKQILSLNDERRRCLELLGVKISIDPFERTRLKEQIDVITSLGDNADRINVIKRNIGNIDALIEDRIMQNNEYSIALKKDIQLMKSEFAYSEELADYVAGVLNENNPSRVISIKNISQNMNMSIVKQKTDGVIERVNTMLNEEMVEDVSEVSVSESNPMLVVEPFVPADVKIEEPIISVPFETKTDDVSLDIQEDTNDSEKEDSVFNDTVPFEDVNAPLFNERVSEDVFDNEGEAAPIATPDIVTNTSNMSQTSNDTMPDVFWTVDDSNGEAPIAQEDSSFDDQIEALIGNNDKPKVLKKVA